VIRAALVFALLASRGPTLALDPCVGVDETTLQGLIELELRDVRTQTSTRPISVAVTCIDGGQEIRAEPWASLGQDGVRLLALPPFDEGDSAAREARARELALAVAELIRRLETTEPLLPAPKPPSEAAPSPSPPPPSVAAASPSQAIAARVRLGVVAAAERWAGGLVLGGGDITLQLVPMGWLVAEARAGARLAPDDRTVGGRTGARAVALTGALGPVRRSSGGRLGIGLLMQAQLFLVQVSAAGEASLEERRAWVAVGSAGLAPQLFVRLGHHVALGASAGVALPVHGARIRLQGVDVKSPSGITVSANAGVFAEF